MDEAVPSSEVAASLSQSATQMWHHFTTVQTSEPHLAMGQEAHTPVHSPKHRMDDQSGNSAVLEGDREAEVERSDPHIGAELIERGTQPKLQEDEATELAEGHVQGKKSADESLNAKSRGEEVLDTHVQSRELSDGNLKGKLLADESLHSKEETDETFYTKELAYKEQRALLDDGLQAKELADKELKPSVLEDEELEAKVVSLAVAAAQLPLPQSPSPPGSHQSSLPSSCFITPASTPSRSPSPPPHSSLYHTNHTSSQVTHLPETEFVDGLQDDEHHNNEPYNPHAMAGHLPTLLDTETQTNSPIPVTSFTQTHVLILQDSSTNTEREEALVMLDSESQTECGEREGIEVGCNTELQITPDLLDRAQLAEQLSHIQSELSAGILERNEAKSQQMVAEELARIVQSELLELRQRNVAETTTRVRLENQIGQLKVELSSAHKELKEKEERVTELEETLKGTSLLVRKLEEQNAVSLMNRGGIDYMLQAKLADARAQEAEQKLEVAQTELLQSQGEVKRLLDRVGETTRDRAEMVSSKVHNHLLKIADERAQTAEEKALQLERELLSLRERYGETEPSFTRPSTYTTTLGGYTSLSSTLLPSYTSSAYSLSTQLSSTTSSVSLEPFKLTFSLPSSTTTVPSAVYDSERAALPSSGGLLPKLPSSTTDRDTGLLKPSEFLAKSGSKQHVVRSTSDSAPSVASSTGTHLPSLELPLPDPTIQQSEDTTKEEKEKGSSSDWSSSDEDDDSDSAAINPLRPSTHSALQAQWEWRAMGETLSDKDSLFPMTTSHTPKKRPPPVAPKPTHHSTHTTSADTAYQLLEDPSSFLDPVRSSGLRPLSGSFPRPRGPLGRSLPSQFVK